MEPGRATSAHSSSDGGVTLDEEMELIGCGKFHWRAGVVCGLANASDAVEMMAVAYILPELDSGASDASKGACVLRARGCAGGTLAAPSLRSSVTSSSSRHR
jgi:hypothetical protein